MKETAKKNNKRSNSQILKPFFSKSGNDHFFSQSTAAEKTFFSPSAIQAKLTLGQSGDRFEREADFTAEKVVSSKGNQMQAKLSVPKIQRSSDVESELQNSKGQGSPLSDGIRSEMESGFGADFNKVRIHTDQHAAQMNQDLGAQAFTYGADIYFNKGKYSDRNQEGKKLLAHELTHTIQQGGVATGQDAIMKTSASGTDIIQRTDAAFESGSGVDTAITAGTMTADAIMGTTFTADNCRGLFGCNVGFNFSKAYKGTYPYSAAGRDVKGIYVKIESVYDHTICGKCDQIRLIQVLRNITKGRGGNIETADPGDATRRERSGWNDPHAPSRGWRIDSLTSGAQSTNPFYENSPGFDFQIGNPAQPAILWDAPGDWATDTNSGKEFQTFLVCDIMGGNKKTVAGINWGYYIDGSGNISFRPATPVATCGPTQELQDAATRWEGIAGNQRTGIDFAAESPVDHEGTRSILWFNKDSTTLRNDSTIDSNAHYAIAIRRIRQHILATMPYTQIIIHGYSSTDGNAGYNMGLSERRAIAIRDRLISEGIPATMLVIAKHGENSDFSPSDLNRRVEIETTRFLGPVLPPHLQQGGGMLGPFLPPGP